MSLAYSLVIPLWNEERNIEQLIQAIESSGALSNGLKDVVFVNNGSQDTTGDLLSTFRQSRPWMTVVTLPQNVNYGGGIYEGARHTKEAIVAMIPGDLQVSIEDLLKIWSTFESHALRASDISLLVKGTRTVRLDPKQTIFVSKVFTLLSNLVLGLKISDVNGLPKMFHKRLLDLLPSERMKTFMFDAQLLSVAREHSWNIIEVPVTFYARRAGVSSWSGKRIKVYRESLKNLFRLRQLRKAPGIPLQPGQESNSDLSQLSYKNVAQS